VSCLRYEREVFACQRVVSDNIDMLPDTTDWAAEITIRALEAVRLALSIPSD
jgi:hypothetical protein